MNTRNDARMTASKTYPHTLVELAEIPGLQELMQTAFLHRCLSGEITRPELETFVVQHYWYSRNFTRYLGALISNLENEADRLELSRNLFDEMGFGDNGALPHSALYRHMMKNMGLTTDSRPLPATTELIATLFTSCRSPNYMIGLGALCLGAEAIVPPLYAAIIQGFLSVGEPLENLHFFTLHVQCDDEHALTMQKIIARELAENPHSRVDMNYGAEKAIRARIRFFEALTIADKPSPFAELHLVDH